MTDDPLPAPIALRRTIDAIVERCSVTRVRLQGPLTSPEIQRVADSVRDLGVELHRCGWGFNAAERALTLADGWDGAAEVANYFETERRTRGAA
jgi:hypothetical protein